MLQAIRDNAQTWIAWVIVSFLIVVFAFWGIQGFDLFGNEVNVAEVDGVEISDDDFQRQYQKHREQQRQQYAQIFGGDTNNPLFEKLMNENLMRKRVLQGMIQSRVITVAAFDAGFKISDDQLNEIIRSSPFFQRDGRFDKDEYVQRLRFGGMTNKGYKARLELDEINRQWQEGISNSVFVTPQQVDAWLKLQNHQRQLSYLILRASDYRHAAKIDDAMINAYYEENPREFMTDEQVSIEYVEFSSVKLAEQLSVSDAELRNWYDENSSDYAVPDDQTQRKTLLDLRKRLLAGEDFAKLAKEFSQDTGSATGGGDLGMFGRNIMEKPFEDAVYALKKGEVSEPVKTSFGLHLIKLTGIQGEQRQASHILLEVDSKKLRTLTYEEVHDQLEKDFLAREAERRFAEQFELLNNLSYEQPDTLAGVAEELKLEIKTTELFGRLGGKGISANPKIATAAFNEEVLAGNNSEPIEVSSDNFIVLRIKQHVPAAIRPLAEVNDIIIDQLLDDVSKRTAFEKGEDTLAKIKAGTPHDEVAKALKLTWISAENVKRDNNKLAKEIINRLFAMPGPVDGKPVYAGITMAGSDYAVLVLESVTDIDPDKLDTVVRLSARRQLEKSAGDNVWTAMQADLQQSADIKILSKELRAAAQ